MSNKSQTQIKTEAHLDAIASAAEALGYDATPLTGASVRSNVSSAVVALASAFMEQKLMIRDDAGKLHAMPGVDEPGYDLVDPTQIEVINHFGFVQKRALEGVVDALGRVAEQATRNVAERRSRLVGMRRAVDSGRSALTEQSLAGAEFYLNLAEEQEAIAVCAYQQAKQDFTDVTGEAFVSWADRKKLLDAAKASASTAKAEANERVARFA